MLDLTPKSLKGGIRKRQLINENIYNQIIHEMKTTLEKEEKRNAEKSGGQSPQEINLVRTKRENN